MRGHDKNWKLMFSLMAAKKDNNFWLANLFFLERRMVHIDLKKKTCNK